jgi:hypothetical protein
MNIEDILSAISTGEPTIELRMEPYAVSSISANGISNVNLKRSILVSDSSSIRISDNTSIVTGGLNRSTVCLLEQK